MSASGSLDAQGSLQEQRYAFYFQWQGVREFFTAKSFFKTAKSAEDAKDFIRHVL